MDTLAAAPPASPPRALAGAPDNSGSSPGRFARSHLEPIPFSDESDSELEQLESSRGAADSPQSRGIAVPAPPPLAYESDEQDGLALSKEQQKEVEHEQILHSGYLLKRAQKRKQWRRRWFVLRSNKLVYYKDQKEYKLLGIVPLDQILACAEVQRKEKPKKRKSKRANVFGIVTTERKFYFSVESPEEMLSWLRAIRGVHADFLAKSAAGGVTPAALAGKAADRDHSPLQRGDQPSLPTSRTVKFDEPTGGAHTFKPTVARLPSEQGSAQDRPKQQNTASPPTSGNAASVLGADTTASKVKARSADVVPNDGDCADDEFDSDEEKLATAGGNPTKDNADDDYYDVEGGDDDDDEYDDYDEEEEEEGCEESDECECVEPGGEAIGALNTAQILKTGLLRKRSGPRKAWKKRWFVLRPTQLVYYKDQREYKSLGIIDLNDIEAVAPLPRKKRTNVFGVMTSRKKYYLQAGSPEELLDWTRALRDACRAARSTVSNATDDAAADDVRRKSVARRSILSAWPATRSSQESTYTFNDETASGGNAHSTDAVSRVTSALRHSPSPESDSRAAGITAITASSTGRSGQMLQGYLTKQSQKNKTWQKRWFTLRDGRLSYYKNDKESVLRQQLPLSQVQSVQSAADTLSKQRPYCLVLTTSDRRYLLAAESAELRDRWVQALNRERERLQRTDTAA
ncbi:hypothetical protein THASP1DRAFT_28470 [Thamnocephalis sphaerospora]|uniref:PH domain-containing protein n=1 Tax=Thamnocephalis sphaerospora TaxID=78915 RepID=A0A4P9XWC8_9FUNG|nr:hypothetical protein THASP1DRAFT_28470 [Thamnocephalis sphaerospora]|eukprot:RKP09730.1 hypothetical protein THASP1DRAFT_28470 [Thamnocephalis sphaerospora]